MVNVISVLTAILTLLAGIGVFLVACTMMSSNLESAARIGHLDHLINVAKTIRDLQ